MHRGSGGWRPCCLRRLSTGRWPPALAQPHSSVLAMQLLLQRLHLPIQVHLWLQGWHELLLLLLQWRRQRHVLLLLRRILVLWRCCVLGHVRLADQLQPRVPCVVLLLLLLLLLQLLLYGSIPQEAPLVRKLQDLQKARAARHTVVFYAPYCTGGNWPAVLQAQALGPKRGRAAQPCLSI